MKRYLLAAALLPGSLLAESAADYVNFIRQVQQDTGVEWDITIPQSGNLISPTGVSEEGSFFQLWAIHNWTAAEYILDEQFVTSYTPNAKITIITNDPYEPVARTRVDQPFRVVIEVTGLLDPSDPVYGDAPEASKRVEYTHGTFGYPAGEHSLDNVANPVGAVVEEGYMEVNGTATVTFGLTNLTGADLTQVEGEEVFSVSALADFGVSATVLDSRRVQVWPVATGSLSGFDSVTYYEDVPPITVSLNNLYPSSTTYVRMYPGPQVSNPSNEVRFNSSYVIIEDSIPQDRAMVLSKIDKLFTEEGYHTLEIMHETPFGVDVLAAAAIRVDRTVEFNGTLYTSE